MKKTKILIVDDHALVRRGIMAMLASMTDLEICGEASNGREAVVAVEQLRPDIVIMDVTMPEMNGVDATRQILKAFPETQILILTLHDSRELAREALVAGAFGYVLKSDAAHDLLDAIRMLQCRKMFVTQTMLGGGSQEWLYGDYTADSLAEPISPREREIVQLLAEGKANKEIAARLEISIKTVQTHRANIMNKLNLHSVVDLVHYAIRNRLVGAE